MRTRVRNGPAERKRSLACIAILGSSRNSKVRQGRSVLQPRVAPPALPWVGARMFLNPMGVVSKRSSRRAATLSELGDRPHCDPGLMRCTNPGLRDETPLALNNQTAAAGKVGQSVPTARPGQVRRAVLLPWLRLPPYWTFSVLQLETGARLGRPSFVTGWSNQSPGISQDFPLGQVRGERRMTRGIRTDYENKKLTQCRSGLSPRRSEGGPDGGKVVAFVHRRSSI